MSLHPITINYAYYDTLTLSTDWRHIPPIISPFFVRNNNNNLDHSIWHMFVLAGEHFFSACLFPEPSLLSFLDPQSFYFYFVICT